MTKVPAYAPDDDLAWVAFLYVTGELVGDALADFERRLEADQSAREAVASEVALFAAMRQALEWRSNEPADRRVIIPSSRRDAAGAVDGAEDFGGLPHEAPRLYAAGDWLGRLPYLVFSGLSAAVVVLAMSYFAWHDEPSVPRSSDATGARPGAVTRYRAGAASLRDVAPSPAGESLLGDASSLDSVAMAWVQTRRSQEPHDTMGEGGDVFATQGLAVPGDAAIESERRPAASDDVDGSADTAAVEAMYAAFGELDDGGTESAAPHWLLAAVLHAPPASGDLPGVRPFSQPANHLPE